jgi:hypothetical protein
MAAHIFGINIHRLNFGFITPQKEKRKDTRQDAETQRIRREFLCDALRLCALA